jgi:uroporphyrinogen-III synthase
VERHTLSGVTVVVTRAADQVSSLAAALRRRGADVVTVPTIEVVDAADGGAGLRRSLDELRGFDWLIVTSANGAQRVAAALDDPGALAAAGVEVAAIGPGTADALARLGIRADLVPERFVAEGLLQVFPAPPPEGGRVLLAQAAGARPVLARRLREAGWRVDSVEAYRTVHPRVPDELVRAARDAHVVTFTSASTVAGYIAAVGVDPAPRAVACIGPITAEAAVAGGLHVDAVADPHTIDGLVDAVEALSGAGRSRP